MPCKHGIFLSFCNYGKAAKVAEPIYNKLRTAVGEVWCAPPYDDWVFFDKHELQPGDFLGETLARGLCNSFCMVLIYMPYYITREYCIQEFLLMKELEEKRLELLPESIQKRGLLFIILLRGDGKDCIPQDILYQNDDENLTRIVVDLSRKVPEGKSFVEYYDGKIEELADIIRERYEFFLKNAGEPCDSITVECNLASKDIVNRWIQENQEYANGPLPNHPCSNESLESSSQTGSNLPQRV